MHAVTMNAIVSVKIQKHAGCIIDANVYGVHTMTIRRRIIIFEDVMLQKVFVLLLILSKKNMTVISLRI